MAEKERSTDKLARLIIFIAALAAAAFVCGYFRGVLSYILIAFVVSLVGQPVMGLLRKLKIKGKSAPDAFLAVVTLILIGALLLAVVTQVIPVVSGIVREASVLNNRGTAGEPDLLARLNEWIISVVPWVGADFDGARLLVEKLSEMTRLSAIPGVIGTVASAAASMAAGLFSVVFIAFFFIKDETLFGRIVGALVPDRIEEQVGRTILDIERLLSRYFVGLIIEILGVVILNFLGLWIIARIGFSYALGIAFIAGLLNVIPYIGPLIGEVIGVVLCVILKYGAGIGLDVPVGAFALIVLGIMLTVQLVDNLVYQPVIYSSSIKANALEIFIVLLVAAQIGGATGMFIAIPAYTVVRVIASRFFYQFKPVRRLIPNREE
jgi:predicted PurR-regulated permease PerM